MSLSNSARSAIIRHSSSPQSDRISRTRRSTPYSRRLGRCSFSIDSYSDPLDSSRPVTRSSSSLNVSSYIFASSLRLTPYDSVTLQLDIIQDWFEEKELPLYRLDGSTKREDRTEQMHQFNTDNSPDGQSFFQRRRKQSDTFRM